MKLDQLRRMALFTMVAKEGSFTAVSQQQNIATSAISAAVSQLETNIGVRLLHRSTRKITLTEEGQAFLKHCQMMLWSAEAAHEALQQLTGELVGELTLTASQSDVDFLVLPALESLLRAHPRLKLNLLVNDHQVDLIEHRIDIAIRAGRLQDSSLIARSLIQVPEAIVASPQYCARHGMPTVENLSSHQIVAFLPFAQPQGLTLITPQGEQKTFFLQLAAKTDSVEAAKQLALMGLGVARLPLSLVKKHLEQGDLLRVMPEYMLPTIQLYMVTLNRDLQPAKVTAAIAALQLYAKQQVGWLAHGLPLSI